MTGKDSRVSWWPFSRAWSSTQRADSYPVDVQNPAAWSCVMNFARPRERRWLGVCCHCHVPSSFPFTSCVHILFWSLLVHAFIYIFSLLMQSSLAMQSFPTGFWCWLASYILQRALASLFFHVLTICYYMYDPLVHTATNYGRFSAIPLQHNYSPIRALPLWHTCNYRCKWRTLWRCDAVTPSVKTWCLSRKYYHEHPYPQEVMTRYDSMVMCRNVLEMGVTMPLHGEITQPPSARRKCSPGCWHCCCSTVASPTVVH